MNRRKIIALVMALALTLCGPLRALAEMNCPESEIFVKEFLGSFDLVLDSVLTQEDKT